MPLDPNLREASERLRMMNKTKESPTCGLLVVHLLFRWLGNRYCYLQP